MQKKKVNKKSKANNVNTIYAILGVTIIAGLIYLLFDLQVINLGGNDEDKNPPATSEPVTPTPPQEQDIPVEKLSFSQKDYSIPTDEAVILKVIITPSDANTSKITWKSSNTSVAVVDQNGYVTGISEGTAVITAESDNGIIAKTKVSVAPSSVPIIEINQVKLSKESMNIKVGESQILQATISPNNATNKTLIWSSSNTSVAVVDQNGYVTGIKEGTATITVKSSNGKSDSITVTVEKSSLPTVDVTGVSLSKSSITLEIGQSSTITASVLPSNATNKTITWSSSNSNVAKVDGSGKITAINEGSAVVTARSNNGKSASITVTVKKSSSLNVAVTGVSLSKSSITLETGQSSSVTASVLPSNATNKTITWTSSNSNIAKVDGNGKITAVSPGKATITATSNNGKKASLTVTVNAPLIAVTGVSVSKSSVQLEVGSSTTVTASVSPTNATNKTITWTSSNSAIAKVDQNGKITAVSSGKATITATSNNGKKASIVVTVPVQPIDSKGRINNAYFQITPGKNVEKSVAEKNSKGITKALNYASTKGITDVSLDQNTYIVANIVNTSDKNNNAAIKMASNVNLDLNNSVIQLYTNYDPKYSVIYFNNVKDASIRNGKIVGDRATHRCYPDGRLIDYYYASDEYKCGSGHGGSHEWGFGIKILASNNITIDDLSISYMTGDGIYMRIRGKNKGTYNTDNITITNNRISKCRRQGISVVSGSNIKIEKNIIHNIRGTAPQLGIDLEPNQPFDIIKNVTIKTNTIYDLGNSKSIGAVGRKGPIENSTITIKNNQLSSCICIPKKPTGETVKLSGNTRINNQGSTVSGNWNINCPK